MMESSIGIVLLAAGSSSRMGQSKQLLSVDGKPLMLKSAEAALHTGATKVVVVLGSREKDHRKILQNLPVEIMYHSDWQKGMGSSLKAGLNHALKTVPGLEAVIVMVCDQPLITTQHLQNVILKYKKTRKLIVASSYAKTTGTPALFDRSLFQELLALENNQGAKKILLEHSDATVSVEFPGGEIDLDTMEDYRAFIRV